MSTATTSALTTAPKGHHRIAGAPISWGVCEVEGWGYQMPTDRVLREMVALGLSATEFGPDGFLPNDSHGKVSILAAAHLRAVGGFVPVVLHDPSSDPVAHVREVFDDFVTAGAGVVVLAASTGASGYDDRPELDDAGWATLLANLDRLATLGSEQGLRAVLHPHVGTMIESRVDVERLVDGSTISLCLDTGHLLIGGTDPLTLASQLPGRVAHVHLKDVSLAVAERFRRGELSYQAAVRAGLYRPLGHGDVDVAGVIRHLEADSYSGWYVLEQDTILDAEPKGEGPIGDVRISAEFVRAQLETSTTSTGGRRDQHTT